MPMDRHQQQEAQIRYRVACEEKAFHVVLQLLENTVTSDYLSDAGQLITQSHYDDVTEERSIAKLCGYPLCNKSLGMIPKQQYRISTKNNMVYDITERKKFCSNFCFQASKSFQKQISTSPVWARQQQPRINFEFLQSSSKRCLMGDEVLHSLPRTELESELKRLEKLDNIDKKDAESSDAHGESFDSPSDAETESCDLLSDIMDKMSDMNITNASDVYGMEFDFRGKDQTKEATENSTCLDELANSDESNLKTDTDSPNVNIIFNKEKQSEEPNCPRSKSESQGQLPGETTQNYVMRLLDRKKHLLGQLADIQQSEATGKADMKMKSNVKHHTKEVDCIDSDDEETGSDQIAKSSVAEQKKKHECPSSQKKWFSAQKESSSKREGSNISSPPQAAPEVIQPLHLVAKMMEHWVTRETLKYLSVNAKEGHSDYDRNYEEICQIVSAQEKEFRNLLKEDDESDSGKMPLPDYKQLEANTKDFELKVREFYRGAKQTKEGKDCVTSLVQLPVVDSHDQMVIRRKIVLDRLHNVMPDLLTTLKLSIQDVSELLRDLVYTFSFNSENILFKPGEWSLVGIILLKLLSTKSRKIELSFKQQSPSSYLYVLLSGIGQTLEDLDNIAGWLVSTTD